MAEPRRRILVVEDEYFSAEELREALHRLGAEVVGPVPTGEAALALLKSEPIDAAVLDIGHGDLGAIDHERVLTVRARDRPRCKPTGRTAVGAALGSEPRRSRTVLQFADHLS